MKKNPIFSIPALDVPDTAIAWLAGCLILAAVFYIPFLPAWGIAGSMLLSLWRLRLLQRGRSLPSRAIRLILAGVVFGSVMVAFQSYLGREPGLTALMLLTGLKLFEIRTYRDFTVALFLCFFLVLGLFLFSQAVLSMVFMLVMVMALCTVLIRVNAAIPIRPAAGIGWTENLSHIRKSGRQAVKLILAALPLVLILFFFFPRSTGPLWNLPQGGPGFGRSGFGEFIRPGYVAWLAQSYDTAFRVRFPDDNMPVYPDLYFRGLVLWFTDGDTWFQGLFPFRPVNADKPVPGAVAQEIILEPHSHSWLFALDRPVSFPSWSGRMPGWTFRSEKPVKRHLIYRVWSVTRPESTADLHPVSRRWGVQLPKRLSARVRRLALQLKENQPNDEAILASVLDYFRQPSFSYSLNPGFLDRKAPIEDFLFRGRKGFCEHFAAAFGVLMRAAGVPTRLVMGYHGGKYNPVGGYLEVRQADAHAWSEVWIEGRGWIRVDPTAVVSPERIQYGTEMSRSISAIPASSAAERSELIRKKLRRGFFGRIWDTLGNLWDNLESNWNLWVIGFDRNRQDGLLDSVGLVDVSWVTLLAAAIGLMMLMVFLIRWVMKRASAARDPLTDLYRRFCRKMKARGVERRFWEGPFDFRDRAVRWSPREGKLIEEITARYAAMRYGRQRATAPALKALKTLIGKLSS